jgi:cobalt/nickel transport system permease protein
MSLTAELFSDIFARQDNYFARLDARVKLIVAGVALLCVIGSTKPFFPALVLALCITATVTVGVPARLIAFRLASPLMLTLVLAGLQTFLNHTPLHRTLPIAARGLAAVSVVLLLSSVTPAHRIFHALRALGMPRGWVEIALLMYRYTFAFLELTEDLICAQKIRLGYSGLKRSLSSLTIVAGTVIVRSLDQAERTNDAMVMRGYRGDIPLMTLPSLAPRDWIRIGTSIAFLTSSFWLIEVRGF